MTAFMSRVSGRGYDYDSVSDCFLGSLIDDALRTRDVFIAAQRNVQHADVVAFTIGNDPLNAAGDIFF